MHIIAAYYKNQTNGVTYDPLTVVTDQALTPAQSQGYQFPKNYKVLTAYVNGVNVLAARINAPSLRNLVLPEIYPANPAVAVPTRPPVVDYDMGGPIVLANESVVVETSSGGAAPGIVSAFLWVTERYTEAPQGPVFTAVASSANTLIAGAWTLSTLTFNQTLPAGQYAVVGMEVVCANAAVARLVFPGVNQWRPGCVVDTAYGNMIQPGYFRFGRNGLFGTFYNTAQPQVEIFGLTAGAQTATVYLDLIKVG